MAHLLEGKEIVSLTIAVDRESIYFQLSDSKNVVARVEADCCSRTWIEHVESPTLPAKVVAVADIDMPEGAKSLHFTVTDQETFYGLKITTDKGDILIDYRNESNGYYGGSLTWEERNY